jgi:cullin 3
MLYGYVREKDVFEHDYQVHLSTRLLAGTSESEHSEKSMISKLKTECGYQWTSKLEGMFKDVQLSKDLSTNFRTLHERKLNFEFDVTVCTSGSWPAQAVPPCRVPTEATAVCQLFKEFYLHSLNGRRLEWRFDMGQADVKVRFGSENVKELIVTPYQMAILLLFNHAESMTYKEIAEASGIAREHLDQHILSLAHPKIKVLLKEPNNPRVDDADKFQLNPAFASKLYKTRVPLIKTTSHVKQEETDRDAEVEMQRKHQVDAALVRIMKTRKTLSHNQLVTEVVQQLSARFTPKVTVIRTRIEHLIEQEYLERDSKDRSVYNYLA